MPLAEISTRRIPVLSYVQAGCLTEARDVTDLTGDFEYVLADADVPETCFALRIDGDSMQPEFKEGDIVIIDPICALPQENSWLQRTAAMKPHSKISPVGNRC